MDIRNVTQFANFVSSTNLVGLDTSFLQIVQCLSGYSAACNCYKKEDKLNMYVKCNKAYHQAVKHVVPKFRHEFLSQTGERQISFYNDQGQLISVMTR